MNQARTIKAVGVETMVRAILYECERERVGGIGPFQHVIRGEKEIKKKKVKVVSNLLVVMERDEGRCWTPPSPSRLYFLGARGPSRRLLP